MAKGKGRSNASLLSTKSISHVKEDIYIPPLDELIVKVYSLRVTDQIAKHYAIKITFIDQLLLTGIIKSTVSRTTSKKKVTIAQGSMSYDPSDSEKMCLFADSPLVVNIQPLKSVDVNALGRAVSKTSSSPAGSSGSKQLSSSTKQAADISCCNVDILPLFLYKEKMLIKKRMEPMFKPSIFQTVSWDNLPLLTMELAVIRDGDNSLYHAMLKRANFMTITLSAAFNVQIPYHGEYIYTAATYAPLHNETHRSIVTYNQGHRIPQRFKPLNFYPKWESLRLGDDIFTKGDKKFQCKKSHIINDNLIDLDYYLSKDLRSYSIVWGSFHRTLMLGQSETWFLKHLRRYSWPFEVHIYGEQNGFSFMAFLNLSRLLYPGEDTVRIAVPLQWVNAQAMQENCGCDLLLTPNDNLASTGNGSSPKAKIHTDSALNSTITDIGSTMPPTGADENCAFIIVEVKLARPLKKAVIPTPITSAEINTMLQDWEQGPSKRECTGRGQLDRDWQSTVRGAEVSLRRVPHYGMTEFCAFNRQLSETRTRVELTTSFWLEAAVYVNNTFVVQEYLRSEETYEEMLMMSHACLTRLACSTLIGSNKKQEVDPFLKAARHARHMQDVEHAIELYLQLVAQNPRSANCWRELSTCLREVDPDWANVCLNKAVVLNPRHPLNLVAKGGMLLEEDPEAAEPFFVALLALYPFWLTGWVIATAYYLRRELFYMADQIMEHLMKGHAEGLMEDIRLPRAWDYELGDWWDHTPILPGMSQYYDATDWLLRLRVFSLAETCLSRAITETGETAASCHMLALSCRLRGNVEDALCHLQQGIDKFGDLSYLRSLQAECFHKLKDTASAMASFEKAGTSLSAYCILLSMPCWETTRARSLLLDLIRRKPSAYSWIALAEDWFQRAAVGEGGDGAVTDEQAAAKACAEACAVQALKCDRQAAPAWRLLARVVVPSARRLYCREMANMFDYQFSEERLETGEESQQSLCHLLGRALRDCCCAMCEHLKL